MRDGMNYPKIVTILAVVFIASLGLCGLSSALPRESAMTVIMMMAGASIGALSFLGILGVAFLWAIAAIFHPRQGTRSGLQKLFDDEERNKE